MKVIWRRVGIPPANRTDHWIHNSWYYTMKVERSLPYFKNHLTTNLPVVILHLQAKIISLMSQFSFTTKAILLYYDRIGKLTSLVLLYCICSQIQSCCYILLNITIGFALLHVDLIHLVSFKWTYRPSEHCHSLTLPFIMWTKNYL